ncbi:molybdate ABC transporter substrate-binding protein [Oceanobacillus sp. CAU 1775]
MVKYISKGIFVFMFLFLVACSDDRVLEQSAGDSEGTIIISAAASLTDVLHDVAESFNKEFPNIQINFNFGASGALKQQILRGAPVDLFFSVAKNHFEQVVEAGFIVEEQVTDLLANELVLIVPKGSTLVTSFDELPRAKRIAIGNPESVPAGEYSMELFQTLEIEGKIKESLIYTEDVRTVLTYVETKNVDAGIVYRTDAIMSEEVDIVEVAPTHAHERVVYSVGIVEGSDNMDITKIFYEFLQSEVALNIFKEYGFDTY